MIYKFRLKQFVVEAIQWDGNNDHEILAFGQGKISIEIPAENITDTSFKRLRCGDNWGKVDWWITKNENNKFKLISKKKFEKRYQVVESARSVIRSGLVL